MLKWMKLKNLALVEEAEIEFGPAFNVISGETGAGKSVIMGAVGLLLGARADKSSIRAGASKCEISAEFSLGSKINPTLAMLLSEAEVFSEEDPGSILIRRVITPSNTKNFINSCPVSLQFLKNMGELLVDIHAANENQSLLRATEQLRILDRFAGLEKHLEETAMAWMTLQSTRLEKETFLNTMPSAEETARMRRDAEEIEKAAPMPGEDEDLKAKHLLASNSRQIIETASMVASLIDETENSLFDKVKELRRTLVPLEKIDSAHGGAFIEKCDVLCDNLSELSDDLRDYAANVELDESEFNAMEERMRVLQTLKRRYGASIENVLAHLEDIRSKIAVFDSAEAVRKDFEQQEKKCTEIHAELSENLSRERKKAAGKLLKMLAAETVKLGFKKAEFDIRFEKIEPSANGIDRIQIFFSANPGVPLKPLSDVASSGEISRVMLSMKTVLAEADSIPVLIFDEIDANIGGETAAKVGSEIAKLAKSKQVICISHLPQVASHALTHFQVSKSSDATETVSVIRHLNSEERISEIARMLGGGKAALEHARTMLNGNADELSRQRKKI